MPIGHDPAGLDRCAHAAGGDAAGRRGPPVIVPLDTIELAPLPQHCGSRLARGSRPDSQMSAMEWPWSG